MVIATTTVIMIVKTGLRLNGWIWIAVVMMLDPQPRPEKTSAAGHAHGEHADQGEKRCG